MIAELGFRRSPESAPWLTLRSATGGLLAVEDEYIMAMEIGARIGAAGASIIGPGEPDRPGARSPSNRTGR